MTWLAAWLWGWVEVWFTAKRLRVEIRNALADL